MTRKRTLILIILIMVSSTIVIDASGLNFGNIVPESELSKELDVLINDPSVIGVEIWLEQNIKNEKEKYILPFQRLRVKYKQEWLPINTEPLRLEFKDEPRLVFSLELFPWDLPGNYRSVLHMKKITKDNKYNEELISIDLEIEPWTKIKFTKNFILLDRINNNTKEISSFFSGVIKIASNGPWKLYSRVENINNFLSEENVNINVVKDYSYQVLKPDGIKLTNNFKSVVVGERTTKNGYWIELPFIITIKDFTNLPAGKIHFPIIFIVRSNQN